VLKRNVRAVHKTNNLVLEDKYAQKTALRLAVAPAAVRAEFKKRVPLKKEASALQPPVSPQEEPLARPPPQEYWLLKLVLKEDEQVGFVASHLDLNWLQHPGVKGIIRRGWMGMLIGHGKEFSVGRPGSGRVAAKPHSLKP
jgi:hypothetical protein